MAIARSPVFKRCGYLGINPLVLGYTHKPSICNRKIKRFKTTEYGLQLKEKQKVRFVYGVLEKQFRMIYLRAEKMPGITGENLLMLMELRFDNIVFRLGLASTRRHGRQMISHGFFLVNRKRMDIPSYTMQIGDVISINEKHCKEIKMKRLQLNRQVPSWLTFDDAKLEGFVHGLPHRNDIDFEITESSIVELYSR